MYGPPGWCPLQRRRATALKGTPANPAIAPGINAPQTTFSQTKVFKNIKQSTSTPDICHGHKEGVRGEKICHVEKFQISVHDR